jgi:hypothetical protein
MNGLSTILAAIFASLGIITIVIAVYMGTILFSLSGLFSLLNCAAWCLVGELWETVDYLAQELYKLKNK